MFYRITSRAARQRKGEFGYICHVDAAEVGSTAVTRFFS